MMDIRKIAFVAFLTASALFAGTYNVDPVHSYIGFKVKHLMISNVKGQFETYNGKFEYDEKTNTLKSLTGNIKVSSINTGIEKRDKHLKSDEIFDAKKYPDIKFVLNKIDDDTAYGKLTIHGVTRDIKLDFDNGGSVKDPWGNQRAGFALNGKINRKDYGITWNKALETGGVVVGDKIRLEIEIEGIKEK